MSFLVVGGGPAGAMAAARLAQAGREVTLLERTRGPADKICGEFLSGEAVGLLHRLGVDLPAGQPIHAVRLVRGARAVECRLPFAARGLSRRVLDEHLLAHAAACGALVRRGVAVSRIEGGRAHLAGGGTLAPGALLLATGKHEVRGARRAPERAPDDMVGFKLHLALAPAQRRALAGHVEVLLFPDCYAGLQLVDDGRANLCLLALRPRLERAGGAWAGLLDDLCRDSPHLRARLGDAAPLSAPLAIYRVPYGHVHRPSEADAAYRLGDQAAVIPSFTGDGMAIALHSAALAAAMALRGEPPAAYHARLRRDVGAQVRRAWRLYRLGRSPAGQAGLMRAARLMPALLGRAAALTRVPRAAQARL